MGKQDRSGVGGGGEERWEGEGGASPADGTAPPAVQPRLRIVLADPPRPKKGEPPEPRYSGIHPAAGVQFRDGVAVTGDPLVAERALELIPGCQVFDEASGKRVG